MKNSHLTHFMFFLIMVISMQTICAQDHFATIKKNYNVLASSLVHELNASKDTLILKSENPILKVYTVGEFAGLINQEVRANHQKIPLQQLAKGKYVFVVDQPSLKIVFQVLVHRDGKDYLIKQSRESNSRAVASELSLSKELLLNSISSNLIENRFSEVIQVPPRSERTSAIVSKRAYNLTDLDRRNMQSREEARIQRNQEHQANRESKLTIGGTQRL